MRRFFLYAAGLGAAFALAGCEKGGEADVNRAVQDVLASDEQGLNEIMLNAASPDEAVRHFKRAVAQNPENIANHRGLAKSLTRAKKPSEAVIVWARVVEMEDATHDDRIGYADALIRVGDWGKAEKVLDEIPPTYETFARYRLEAMIADSNKEWSKSDSFYETAVSLTTRPANVLNNWGYSKLSRGDDAGAERLFVEAINYDPNLFTAKNNLVLARAAQRNYQLPVLQMSQIERAQLLHTMALAAIKQGDVTTGRGLLEEAIETHPQHFEAAARSLRALESKLAL